MIRTVELFPCPNYEIRLFHHIHADTLFIDIGDFISPVPCAGGMDVASAERLLPRFVADTMFAVIRWNGKSDRWRVRRNRYGLLADGVRPEFTSWLR